MKGETPEAVGCSCFSGYFGLSLRRLIWHMNLALVSRVISLSASYLFKLSAIAFKEHFTKSSTAFVLAINMDKLPCIWSLEIWLQVPAQPWTFFRTLHKSINLSHRNSLARIRFALEVSLQTEKDWESLVLCTLDAYSLRGLGLQLNLSMD